MTFGENLQFLRKRRGMTQEELAEKMEVSRQSVSKWESNAAYPEMDAILRLCDLFSCDMDTLLRGDASRRFGEDAAAYDKHMNGFSAAIAAGVGLILLGVILMLFLGEFLTQEMWAGVVFFLFLIAAVAIFIVSGMNHDIFLRQHPGFVPCYTKEEMDRFERRFPFLIAIPVALILAGLAAMIPMDMNVPSSFSKDQWDALLTTLFLLCVTIAVIVLVWAGIQHSKYGFPEEKQTPAERRSGRIWGFGMLAATAVYVGLGLTMNWWHKAWAIYPIAALICAAFTVLLKKDDEP
ncbi:MAG: helix-turn-helix domain-containing protein [Oscillospiraceae bacterium]|nr:helix-turn-helix domain-containing protein [Oscillospiraceae bacterium]